MRCFLFLLVVCSMLAMSRHCSAQDQDRPFIKISHIGVEESPLFGAFICSRASLLDEKMELVTGYRSEPVFVVKKSEFNTLLRFVERYVTTIKPVPPTTQYGTFQLTYSNGKGEAHQLITNKDDSLGLIMELSAVVDRFEAANRKSPELWNTLKVLASRLSY